jgi:hypothetical protein
LRLVNYRTIRNRFASGFVPILIALASAAHKAAHGPLAKWIRARAPHSGRLALPSNGEPSLPAVAFGGIPGNGSALRPATPRKPVTQAALAVKHGFKEF